jgi:hypothetical protein
MGEGLVIAPHDISQDKSSGKPFSENLILPFLEDDLP